MAKPVHQGISLSALKERLRQEPSGVYVFYGQEELLKRFWLGKFQQIIEKEGAPEFNLSRLDFAADATLGMLEEEIGILPVMGEHRLIVCRGLELVKLSEKELERLLSFLEDPMPGLILVFFQTEEEFPADKNTWKKKSVTRLAEKATFVPFPLQDERVLLTWSKKILAKDGITAEDRTLRDLFRMAGNRMQTLQGQLNQLACYALSQNRSTVTAEDVALFAREDPEYALYQLSDAVLMGRAVETERMLHHFHNQKVEPIVAVAALSRAVVNTLVCISGATAEDVFSATGMAAWQVERCCRDHRGKRKEDLEAALEKCIVCDRLLKSTSQDPYRLLERLCLELCGMFRRER